MTTIKLIRVKDYYVISYPGVWQPVGSDLAKAKAEFAAMRKRVDTRHTFLDLTGA